MSQLELGVPDAAPDPSVLAAWRGLPYRDTRRCADCGAVAPTAGRRRSSQRCLTCFAATRVRRRRRTRS